ncbi:hypothetical protein B7486_15625 [cyanobacterium TDX16]|nr:hypothetical protein B7486_15625 [cyanobacterium TDX16]
MNGHGLFCREPGLWSRIQFGDSAVQAQRGDRAFGSRGEAISRGAYSQVIPQTGNCRIELRRPFRPTRANAIADHMQ